MSVHLRDASKIWSAWESLCENRIGIGINLRNADGFNTGTLKAKI
jgi:hypothetical protein